jgi:hypothetical protein
MALTETDRNRVGSAIYAAWCQIHGPRGPWRSLADWQKENFRMLADAAEAELSLPAVTARVVRIERNEQKAG